MRVMPITLTMDLSAPRMEPSTSAGVRGRSQGGVTAMTWPSLAGRTSCLDAALARGAQ